MKHDKCEPGLFKEEFRFAEMSKYSRRMFQNVLEENNNGSLQKYRKVLETANCFSTNRIQNNKSPSSHV